MTVEFRDSRSVNAPEKTKRELVLDEMERVIVEGRYSKDPVARELIAKISAWRAELTESSK